MGSTPKAQLLHPEVWWLSSGKGLVQLFELQAELATFFLERHFYSQECLIDKPQPFRIGYSEDKFLKMN